MSGSGENGSRTLILTLTAGLLVAVFFIFPWSSSSSEVLVLKEKTSVTTAGLFRSSASTCYPPNPPLSIEWVGRPSMTISFSPTKDVEVQMNDFPGSMLRE